jgi:murein DD-endopeptidase MepM/ murein hydrolase activator NlpD
MLRRSLLGIALVLLIAAPAGADTIHRRKDAVEARIAKLNAELARSHTKAKGLQAQIAGVSTQIRSLERQVGDVSRRLAPIERELELREIRLNRLNVLFQLQSDRLAFLRRQYGIALTRLNARLVAIYEAGGEDDTLSVAFSATSFSDFLDAFDYAKQIAEEDKLISTTVHDARDRVHGQLAKTKVVRARVLGDTRIVAFRVRQVRELRDQLVASHSRLAQERARHRADLDRLSESERNEEDEIHHLQAADIALEAKIRGAEAAGNYDSTPSSRGLVWPVPGPITSGFGPRWGSFHYGIDIGAGYGTPIRAAAAGTVIYSGWYDGFGNFVVIDHGGGLTTTYGHQSRIAVSLGERVAQGQLVGYVGSTGFSTGPHLDFEVRVGGRPVDPLGYL